MTKFIVELCQNHGGDRTVLSNMIKAAAGAGADYVKIQTIFASELTKRPEFESPGTPAFTYRPYEAEYKRLSQLELSLDDHKWFIDQCVSNCVIPLTTVFTKKGLETISTLEWPLRVLKVASYDSSSYPFISRAASLFDHLIISTGASYNEEISCLSSILSCHPSLSTFSLLHCVTKYPTAVEDGRILRIPWLRQFTSSVGFSDHSSRDYPLFLSQCAIYLGTDYIERHFTILPFSDTKDGPVSITHDELLSLVEFSRSSKSEQLSFIQRNYAPSLIRSAFSYAEGMSSIDEVAARNYYRGRFASSTTDGIYDYNWL